MSLYIVRLKEKAKTHSAYGLSRRPPAFFPGILTTCGIEIPAGYRLVMDPVPDQPDCHRCRRGHDWRKDIEAIWKGAP